jgi:hypothetical protein
VGGQQAEAELGLRHAMSGERTAARHSRSWQEMREPEIQWLIERTGDGLETWCRRPADHEEAR